MTAPTPLSRVPRLFYLVRKEIRKCRLSKLLPSAVGIMDQPEATAPGYSQGDVIWGGLGLVPFTIIPHQESDHVEAPLAAKAVAWATEQQVPFRALRAGDVLLVEDGGTPTILRRAI